MTDCDVGEDEDDKSESRRRGTAVGTVLPDGETWSCRRLVLQVKACPR